MKTKTPADPAKLRKLARAMQRVAKNGAALAKHAQLRLAILDSIHAGHWTAGDRLPPETELTAATGLSMGTVQRALRDLTEAGVVRRQQGSGSFVATAPHRIDDVAHCRFLDDDGRTVLPVFSEVLGRRARARNGPWSRHFTTGASIIELDRVLTVNDEFDVFNRFYFDGDRFTGLASRSTAELAGTNFKALLAQEAQVPPGGVSQTMTLIEAPREIGQHMGLPEGAWVAQMDIVRHIAGSSEALYYQQMFIPPTTRRLVTQEAA